MELEYKQRPIFSLVSFAFVAVFLFLGVKKLQIAPSELILHQKQTALTHFTLVNNHEHYEMYTGNYRLIQTYETHNVNHAQKTLAFAPALFHKNPKKIRGPNEESNI